MRKTKIKELLFIGGGVGIFALWIVYIFFTPPAPRLEWRSPEASMFVKDSIVDFCRELQAGASCKDASTTAKNVAVVGKVFGNGERKSVTEVDAILEKLGWNLAKKTGRTTCYCRGERTASYSSADGLVLEISFEGGSETCRKK